MWDPLLSEYTDQQLSQTIDYCQEPHADHAHFHAHAYSLVICVPEVFLTSFLTWLCLTLLPFACSCRLLIHFTNLGPLTKFLTSDFCTWPHFLIWIASLYSPPSAYLKYAGYKSDLFPVCRRTRQGCPLPPHLFALAIEPLTLMICSNPDIKGLELGGHHHKLCLFVDDILLFHASPLTSTPNLLSTLDQFASISGLVVNPQKSKALNVSLPQLIV